MLRRAFLVLLVAGALLQAVPYGWWHENPPETDPVGLADPRAAALFEGACADCHTNRTDWPVYAYVAPMSWLVRRDVEAGRAKFNLSEWSTSDEDGDNAADEVEDGDMPPRQYKLAHPDARLSAEDREILANALEQLEDPDKHNDDDAREDDDRSGSNSGKD